MLIQKFIIIALSAISTIANQQTTINNNFNFSHVVKNKTNETSFLSENETAEPIINITTNTYDKIQFKITNYNLLPNSRYINFYNAKKNSILKTFLIVNTEDVTYTYQCTAQEQQQEIRLELKYDDGTLLKTLTKPAKPTEYDNPQITIKENLYNKFTFTIDNLVT